MTITTVIITMINMVMRTPPITAPAKYPVDKQTLGKQVGSDI